MVVVELPHLVDGPEEGPGQERDDDAHDHRQDEDYDEGLASHELDRIHLCDLVGQAFLRRVRRSVWIRCRAGTVGIPPVKASAASAISEHRYRGTQPVDPRLLVCPHGCISGGRRHLRLGQGSLELGVGNERDARGQFRLRL